MLDLVDSDSDGGGGMAAVDQLAEYLAMPELDKDADLLGFWSAVAQNSTIGRSSL